MCLFSKSDKKCTKELLEAKKVKGVNKVMLSKDKSGVRLEEEEETWGPS